MIDRVRLASGLTPLLRLMDAERAHALALRALAAGLVGQSCQPDAPALAVRAMGLSFSNPIGLAAGFDKSASVSAASKPAPSPCAPSPAIPGRACSACRSTGP